MLEECSARLADGNGGVFFGSGSLRAEFLPPCRKVVVLRVRVITKSVIEICESLIRPVMGVHGKFFNSLGSAILAAICTAPHAFSLITWRHASRSVLSSPCVLS